MAAPSRRASMASWPALLQVTGARAAEYESRTSFCERAACFGDRRRGGVRAFRRSGCRVPTLQCLRIGATGNPAESRPRAESAVYQLLCSLAWKHGFHALNGRASEAQEGGFMTCAAVDCRGRPRASTAEVDPRVAASWHHGRLAHSAQTASLPRGMSRVLPTRRATPRRE